MSLKDLFKKKEDGVDFTHPAEPTMAEQIDDNAIEPQGASEHKSKKGDANIKKAMLTGGAVLALLLIGGSLMAMMGGDEKQAQSEENNAIKTDIEANGSGNVNLDAEKDRIAEEERKRQEEERLRLLAEQQAASDTAASDVVITDNTQTVVVQVASEPAAPPVNLVLERRLGGSVLVNEGSLKEKETETTQAAATSGDFEQTNFNEENSEKSFNLSGSVFTPRAAQQRGDKTLLLTRGTTIPCVLVTKIVTDHAGITKCQATKDVWSANGKTVLIERGSVFLGEQTAAMLQGQARVAVRWTQVETPKGVVVQIDSPSVGKLGAAGNAAYVNYHFWKRFGGSVMISLIGDLSNGLGKRLSKRDADVTFEQSNENANQMAEEALRNSINIPPTGTINQGALLNIMVARDVDFNGVYERVDLNNLMY